MKLRLKNSGDEIREKIFYLAISAALLLISACSVGPDYVRPALETPAAYKETEAAKNSQSVEDVVSRNWWEIFADPELNSLEQQVEISNQNVAQAEAQFRQARALVQAARAAYFPTVTVGVGITRTATSATSGASTSRNNQTFTQHSLPVDVSWELDVWGRIRRTVESSEATAQASAADLEAATLSARAELAQDYFQLRSLDGQKQLLDNTAVAFEKSLELTNNRYRSGIASRGDVLQAETQLKTTQAQAIDVGVQRAQLEHAIALLIGKAPADLTIAAAPAGDPAADDPCRRAGGTAETSARRRLCGANGGLGQCPNRRRRGRLLPNRFDRYPWRFREFERLEVAFRDGSVLVRRTERIRDRLRWRLKTSASRPSPRGLRCRRGRLSPIRACGFPGSRGQLGGTAHSRQRGTNAG